MTGSERLAIALAHARLGREVFPFSLEPPDAGGRRAKVPKVKWTEVATTDEATIRKWWLRWPLAMPGWKLPPGLVTIDVDDPALFEAAGLDLDTTTASQQTPRGGYHLLYEHDDRPVRQTVKEVPGADTRVGGKGWVGLYAADSFAGGTRPAPEFLYGTREESPRAELGDELGTRDEILRWVGTLRRARMAGPEILAALLAALESGHIVDLDEARPWTEKDLAAIAKEAEKWKPGVDTTGFEGLDSWKAKRKPAQDGPEIGEEFFTRLDDIDPSDPRPLALGFLDPDDHTILFGDGGTGKGVVAAWWVAELSKSALVFVLDYEAHARFEWRPRVERLGGDMSRVWIAQPGGDPIWKVAARTREAIEELRPDPEVPAWIVVDSIGYACIGTAVEDSGTAIKYSQAIAAIGLPTLSLAHTTKADADPKHPFGSVFWSNGARVTIGMTGTKQDPWRRLENKKTNQRGYFPTIEVDWSWALEAGGTIPRALAWKVFDGAPKADGSDLPPESARRRVWDHLVAASPAGLTVEELIELTGSTARTVRTALSGLAEAHRVAGRQAGPKDPKVWRALDTEGFER